MSYRSADTANPIVAMVLSVMIVPLGVHSLQAQTAGNTAPESSRWFPSGLVVRPLIGSPARVDIGGGPMAVKRDSSIVPADYSPEADVAFGYRLPLLRLRDGSEGGPALDLSVEGGLVARFALGSGHNGLINSDFRAAFPLGMRFGARWEGIISLAHVSSHLGDNLLEQEPITELKRVSRNGIEATALYRVAGGLRAYVGGDYNFSTARTETWAGRFGVNLDREPDATDSHWLLGSADVAVNDMTDKLSFSARAGVGLKTGSGELRFGVTAHHGPSEMGQFRTAEETFIGAFLSVVPGAASRSGSIR